MVEFALIMPVLLILIVGVADLGRAFAAGIVVEGAARDGAELGARAYLKDNPTGPPPPGSYFQSLHGRIARAVCAELKTLPNTTFDSATATCPGLPLLICVHDGVDDACSAQPFGATPPAECTVFNPAPANTRPATGETSAFVEVRVCYPFTMITQVPYFSWGTIFLQQSRSFTVTDY